MIIDVILKVSGQSLKLESQNSMNPLEEVTWKYSDAILWKEIEHLLPITDMDTAEKVLPITLYKIDPTLKITAHGQLMPI